MWNRLPFNLSDEFLFTKNLLCVIRHASPAGLLCPRQVRLLDRRDKTVSQPRKRFHKARVLGEIAQNAAQFVDGSIQAVFVADVGVRPELLAKRPASHHLACMFEQ